MNEHEHDQAQPPPFAHGQLGYLQIPALDITASARFYERTFGWRVAPPEPGFEAPGLIGQWVTDRAPAPDAGPVGWIHVDDIGHSLEDAVRAGATVLQEPTVDGPRLLASLSDPAGNLVGIVQAGAGATSPPAAPRRGVNRTMPDCSVIPELVYADVPQAIEWLCDKFGLIERWHAGDHRAQLSFGRCTVAITEPRTSKALPGRVSMVLRVDDARAHHDRARSRGARIVQELKDYPYGERQYTAEDLGGHHWCFSESIADVAPEEWGGSSGPGLRRAGARGRIAPAPPPA
jgi:predicted enzyme related to lactoylglutathione lyase